MNEADILGCKNLAVLDVGSNSVRAGLFKQGKLVGRTLVTCRLGEGVENGILNEKSIYRTVEGIKTLLSFSKDGGAEYVCAFATEAVRRAKNRSVFLDKVKEQTGLDIYVVSGEGEAELALSGALSSADGTVIDLGGASTEVAVRRNGKTVYSHSLNVGAVVLNDLCGRDKSSLSKFIGEKVNEYGDIPASEKVIAIGGTATSLAGYYLKLKEYDPKKTHGTVISLTSLSSIADELENAEPSDISSESCVDPKRAEIIFGGALLLKAVAEKCGAKFVSVSESDNLEGFYEAVRSGVVKPGILKL